MIPRFISPLAYLLALFILPTLALSLPAEAAESSKTTIQAKVSGLVCEMCGLTLKETFEKTTPIDEVKVDIDSKVVTFIFSKDPELTEEKLGELISEGGYKLESVVDQKELKG